MRSHSEMFEEVRTFVDEAKARSSVVAPDWVTQEIVSRHDAGEGPEADWFLFHAFAGVRNMVREVLRRYKLDPETAAHPDPQTVFEGWERIQTHYLTVRNDEPVIVRIEAMTTDEGEAKAQELERMGRGCFEHAQELRRYFAERAA